MLVRKGVREECFTPLEHIATRPVRCSYRTEFWQQVNTPEDVSNWDSTRKIRAIVEDTSRYFVHQVVWIWRCWEAREPFNISEVPWNYNAGMKQLLPYFFRNRKDDSDLGNATAWDMHSQINEGKEVILMHTFYPRFITSSVVYKSSIKTSWNRALSMILSCWLYMDGICC